MKISEIQEESISERKLYLGVENFSPVAVNPTKQELIDMGINAQEEPVYLNKVKRDFGDGEQEYDQASIRVFLDNNNPDQRIRTQVNLNIINRPHLSSTGKYLVVNQYGSDTWLEEKFIGNELPQNMQWFVNEGVKKAMRGEPLLVEFMKALYNLPYVNQASTPEQKKKGVAAFSQQDIDKLFQGNFSDIRKMIFDKAKDQKVGFLLGVRKVDDTYRQTVFNKNPLKSYVAKTNKTDRLIKEVKEAQENGAYADAIFDLNDTKLKEFDEELHTAKADGSIAGNMPGDKDDLPF